MGPLPTLPLPNTYTNWPNQMAELFLCVCFCRENCNGSFSMKPVHCITNILGHFVMQIKSVLVFFVLISGNRCVHYNICLYSIFFIDNEY